MRLWNGLLIVLFIAFSVTVFARSSILIKMYDVSPSGHGRYIGTIIAKDTRRGLLLLPRLQGLSPGYHGFHLHENPSCQHHGEAAGGHWDPKKTGHHRGPYRQNGHQGDLPVLYVNLAGVAKRAVLAPHLTVSDLKHHTLMIHQGGDNYTDNPPNGGGGARVACGVIH